MVPIASSGLADDTAVLSASWEEAELQHLWLLDFFTAHHLRLNSSKSYCIVGSGRGTSMAAVCEAEEARLAYERSVAPGSRSRQDERDALRARHDEARARAAMPDLRFLPDIEEDRVHDPAGGRPVLCGILDAPTPLRNNLIVSRPRSYPFRYLGLMLRVDGHADEAIGVLSGRVWSACRSIRTLGLDLVQASDYIREFLYPRLELGLAFTRIPKQDQELGLSSEVCCSQRPQRPACCQRCLVRPPPLYGRSFHHTTGCDGQVHRDGERSARR